MAKVLTGVVLALLVLGIGGFANYQRNADLDTEFQKRRPYRGTSDADLELLIQAYTEERLGLQARLDSDRDRTGVMDGYAPSDFNGKLKAFERFQRKNESWREANRAKLERELVVEEIRREQAIRRSGMDSPWKRIRRRVLSF